MCPSGFSELLIQDQELNSGRDEVFERGPVTASYDLQFLEPEQSTRTDHILPFS